MNKWNIYFYQDLDWQLLYLVKDVKTPSAYFSNAWTHLSTYLNGWSLLALALERHVLIKSVSRIIYGTLYEYLVWHYYIFPPDLIHSLYFYPSLMNVCSTVSWNLAVTLLTDYERARAE